MSTAKAKQLIERSDDTNAQPDEAEVLMPIIVSLGKKSKKQIKRLKRGKGRTMDDVMDVIEQVQANLGEQATGKVLVPVVILYRKKQRRFRGLF